MGTTRQRVDGKARDANAEDVLGVVATYRAHVFSLLLPILKAALLNPSSLWVRAALLPAGAFFLTWQTEGHKALPYVAAALAAAFVPLAVALFIGLQLHIICRKGTESGDLTETLPVHFGDGGGRFLVSGGTGGDVSGCLGIKRRTGGQAELVYFAVRPGLAGASSTAESLLEAAISHARQAGFQELVVKLNSAETCLLSAARDAGFGNEQRIQINAWFCAYRLSLKLRKGR